ncbi:mitochondrial carrier domain-containing protein [Xylaria bambusicola]|uniref:mitochondrial carrier domain-containing protein n=1 Tax=Xylaria bambusicola TaxID=326684 RepID=UPI002007B3E0|nr:mitochondrial carrier domain-containing protein [Xylaria bambusicola]KAI0526395.1 mitochondrial carrier domain-containing protein [Xylaria bambusicola]
MPSGRDDGVRLSQHNNLYRGVLPVVPPDGALENPSRKNAATAASAAGVRALSAQAIAFYFRAPVKAFFRTRVDYLAYARSVHQAQTELLVKAVANDHTSSRLGLAFKQAWQWARGTTPGLLTTVIRQHGWSVVPEQILPPLIANVSVGALLYTSYLQVLGALHEESSRSTRRVFPPPDPIHTFTAGFLAGSIQSLVAAPLDAIQARYDHRDLVQGTGGKPRSIWSFSAEKLREIGVRGVFAGWGLSFIKDSFGSAIFFSTFEYVKAQGYYKFITWYYSGLNRDMVDILARKRPTSQDENKPLVIRPHYAIEPMFLLFAGVGASFAQQVLLHPLTYVQNKHWDHLEDLDAKAQKVRISTPDKSKRRFRMLRAYYRAYQETWAQCASEAASEGKGVVRMLYRGFWWTTIRQVPSTSAGLIIFELVRRKYGNRDEPVRVATDHYEILLD